MKKLGLAIAVASALGASSAVVHAYGVGEYANGVLIPFARYASDGNTFVAVGLISSCGGKVYWNYYDANSVHLSDDSFPMTKNDIASFVMTQDLLGTNTADRDGYLVFAMDNDGGATEAKDSKGRSLGYPDGWLTTADKSCLAGNAFLVDVAHDDVLYIPNMPLMDWDFNGDKGVNLAVVPQVDNVTGLTLGAWEDDMISLRYYIDGQPSGIDSQIYLWTVCQPPSPFAGKIYNDDQDDHSVTFPLPNAELNIIDVESDDFTGLTSGFTDGIINWYVKGTEYDASKNPGGCTSDDNIDALSWTSAWDPRFGAAQALNNPHSSHEGAWD